MRPSRPVQRLKSAVIFSFFVVAATALSAWQLSSHVIQWSGEFFARGWILAFLTLATVLSVWVLVAALLGVRPALSHALGRWVWVWTLLYTCSLGLLALFGARSEPSIASALINIVGTIAFISGVVGLVFSAIPPRARRDFYGRPMETPEEWDAN